MNRACLAALACAAALAAAGASGTGAAPDPLPERLSQTGLFVPGTTTVRDDVLRFSPQYPLWSDGASKQRWIRLPAGASIDASDPDAWSFPPGTKLWKTFGFGAPAETRLIERLPDGTWRFAAYVWEADGRDATLAPADGAVIAVAGAPGGRHVVPSRQDCLACHEGASVPVLGFSALQLSPDRDPLAPHAEPRGAGDTDLATLAATGRLRNLPPALLAQPPRIAARSGVERAALGYLHANCGHCHNDAGALGRLDLSLGQRAVEAGGAARTLASLVGRDSRFRAAGSGGTQRIAASRDGQSVLALRMKTRNPLARMPPLGVQVVDDEGVALVERWIRQDVQPTTAGDPR
ncbi:MAG TPA: hypothetical protein VFX05_04145 [Casimicrobiaceae bacterium]|nr:hypothetical protein [Casimicrobiaceae bacterium]